MTLLVAPLVLSVALAGAADPRPDLVRRQLDQRLAEALAAAEQALADGDEGSAALGLDYLRGHLLEQLGRRQESAQAFGQALSTAPRLELYTRYRLALHQEHLGHPEVAAGLVAKVVDAAPAPLVDDAVRLLVRTLRAGGDCRLLGGIDRGRLSARNRRSLELALGDCALAEEPDRGREIYLALLREDREDEPAREAAERLLRLAGPRPPDALARLLAETFHWHRQFDRSTPLWLQLTDGYRGSLGGERHETVFNLARGLFWQEQFLAAAAVYGDLADRTPDRRRQAVARYQQARSLELASEWAEADARYREAYRTDPTGRLADAALIAALRLEWRSGDEASALELFELIAAQRRWTAVAARSALFLAASDLASGRRGRAGHWLDQAERGGRDTALEVAYWRGRLAELDGEPVAAVGQYLRVLERELFHPLAQDARRRLAAPGLVSAATAVGRRLAASGRADEAFQGWLLLPPDDRRGAVALERVRAAWAADRTAGPVVTLTAVPVERWPLWQASLREPEELLLALGIFDESGPAINQHFPLASADLGYTGGALLARAGATRRSISRAESLRQRASRVESPLLPTALRRLLYPFAYGELLVDRSLRHGIDPYLLAAIIREESRFDPRALSPAAARGLTQFVTPTAERIAGEVGLGPIVPDDLYRPEIAVALGAAYLGQLMKRFDRLAPAAVASYNAGEPQAELWRRHCFTDDPAEYLTKVSFTETRAYVARVLGSWGQYRDVYRDR